MDHRLRLESTEQCTVGACSCGAWRREADTSTLILTGLSREEALRSAHALHASGSDAAA